MKQNPTADFQYITLPRSRFKSRFPSEIGANSKPHSLVSNAKTDPINSKADFTRKGRRRRKKKREEEKEERRIGEIEKKEEEKRRGKEEKEERR